jgi:hypothetical protein
LPEHVIGLEVPVDEPTRVRRGEPGPRREHHGQDLAPRPLRLAEPRAQRGTIDELHRDEHAIARKGADIVHGDHVRVREPRHGLRLAQQPCLVTTAGAGWLSSFSDLAISTGSNAE